MQFEGAYVILLGFETNHVLMYVHIVFYVKTLFLMLHLSYLHLLLSIYKLHKGLIKANISSSSFNDK